MSFVITTSNNDNVLPRGSKLATSPTNVADSHSYVEPEFAGHKEIRFIFGLSRTHLFRLAKDGKIKSASVRDKGKVKGRRLYNIASIRAFLHRCMAADTQTAEVIE